MEAGVNLYLEVYIDVIFLINFIMDMILLQIVKKILKCSSGKFRIIGGAAIGAGGACILAVVPNINGLVQFLIAHVFICTAMICIAYHQVNWKARIKAVIVLYITTFFLGGVMNSLYYYSKLGYYFRELIDGKLFQNRNKTYFAFAILVGFTAVHIFIETLRSFRGGDLELYPADFFYGDKSVRIVGLLDTGNSLYDPIYGKPVLIAEFSALAPLLSVRQSNMLQVLLDTVEGNVSATNKNEASLESSINYDDDEDRLNIMMIPYHSIGKKNGMLPAIVLNRVVIWDGEEQICNEKVLTAVSGNRLSRQSEYQVILHRDIM